MRTESTERFPPGEVGKHLSVIPDLKDGDHVYVRMEYKRLIDGTGAAQCYVRNPDRYSFVSIPVPTSQIICREPEALFVNDEGIARDVEIAPIAEKAVWK